MTTPPRIDHVLLTRFNLPTAGLEGLVRAREGWLQQRIQLFETYCAPSVAQQTRPLVWIVYFDPESPQWLMDRIRPLAAEGLLRPVLRSSVDQLALRADIAAAVPDRGDVLLTTNLDNDDGLAADFAARLQAVETTEPRVAIYQTWGLIKSAAGVYLRKDRHNAFCSVREPWPEAVTAWSTYHNEFGRSMPVIELNGEPGWLQVVHGANVSNRVRGRLVDPRPYRLRFGAQLNDGIVPSRRQVIGDRLAGAPLRTARDGLRSAMRIAGLRLLGRVRYQDAKRRLSQLRIGARPS